MNIESLDTDGALRETADRVDPTRAGFIARAALAAGGLMGGGAVLAALPETAGAASKVDIDILNFALTLEYLEANFYARALNKAGLHGRERHFAAVVGGHEQTHVAFLKKALGSHAIKKPKFDFGAAVHSRSTFLQTSVTLEDTGVAAYKGQAPRIRSKAYLASALSIHSVEAKHAAWVRYLVGGAPAPAAAEGAKTMSQVLTAVGATGFIVG